VITNKALALPPRRQALRELIKTREGIQRVLAWAQAESLPADLRLTAAMEICYAPWPDLREQGAEILPPPLGQDGQPLPPLAELAARRGNAAKGEKIFNAPEVNCIGCHVVHGQGVVLGPDLSEIAGKLDREGLLENLLDPNATITEKYEAWQVILNNEDEVYGVLAGETADELAFRDAKNNLLRVKKSAIKKRQQLTISIMPLGLQQTMSAAELADLVEYLASLKKPGQ
jgi:putative heme-binding domain-containing protein